MLLPLQSVSHKYITTSKECRTCINSAGLTNWRKATEQFSLHENSDSHKTAVTTHLYEDRSVQCQLAGVVASQQEEGRACLLKITGAVQLLARQGGALRGRALSEGNLALKYKAEEGPCHTRWLASKAHVYTCGVIQKEFLNLISSSIVRDITDLITSTLAVPCNDGWHQRSVRKRATGIVL